MPEHRIRIRGAWDRASSRDNRPGRVDLPHVWAEADASSPFYLTRKFGSPRFNRASETIALELADVPGLRAVRLNGRRLEAGPGEIARIELGSILLDRNLLELDVDLAGLSRAEIGSPWGQIALVISGRSGP